MSRRKAFYLILISLGLLGLAAYRIIPQVSITNNTGQEIQFMTLEVSGVSRSYSDVLQGKTVKKSLRIERDSRFMVTYQTVDGVSARIPVGHIEAPAWWSRTHITIHSGGALDIRYD